MRVPTVFLAVALLLCMVPGLPEAAEVIVTTTGDSGTGSLRWAIGYAGTDDIITFDPAVFPVGSPATIMLSSGLPALEKGEQTIDASAAGVILDGSAAGSSAGLVVASSHNTVKGLTILNFTSCGLMLSEGVEGNTIEGNTISSNGGLGGVEIYGSGNVLQGNCVGVDSSGFAPMGNDAHGVFIEGGANNRIGPGNRIAFNGGAGVRVNLSSATGNTITRNSIMSNALDGIELTNGGNGGLGPPTILEVPHPTIVFGSGPPFSTIEVFTGEAGEGPLFEGSTTCDDIGFFYLSVPDGIVTSTYVTATATDVEGNTSGFSADLWVATHPTTWGKIKAKFKE
jgi:parallel beta-helix repeat protein